MNQILGVIVMIMVVLLTLENIKKLRRGWYKIKRIELELLFRKRK